MSTKEDIPLWFDIRFIIFVVWVIVASIGVVLLKSYDYECAIYLTAMCAGQLIIQGIIYLFVKLFED